MGLLYTLYLTRVATNAATEQARIAKQHLALSERPWVSIEPQVAQPLVFLGDRDPSTTMPTRIIATMHLRLIMKNVGNSVALDASPWVALVYLRKDEDNAAFALLKEQWFLTNNVPLGKKRKEKLSPINVDPTGLFRRFAQISLREVWTVTEKRLLVPATQNNPIVTFAEKYGLLTDGVTVQITQDGQRDADNLVIGEPLSLWETEIELMRRALHVVDKLRVTSDGKPDLEELGKVIVWNEGDAVAYEPQGRWDGLREIILHKHLKHMTLKRGTWTERRGCTCAKQLTGTSHSTSSPISPSKNGLP